MRWMVVVGAGLMAFAAQAKTVAWWHLDELEDGVKAKGGRQLFLNAVNPEKHAGLPRASPKVDGDWQKDSAYEPSGVAAFPAGGVYRDYVNGTVSENPRGVRFNAFEAGTRGTGSMIIIPNDAELAPESFTFEFFMMMNDLSGGVTCEYTICGRNAVAVTDEGQDNGGFKFYWNHSNHTLGVSLTECWWDSEAQTKNTTIVTPTGVDLDMENGRWHHLALTFDSATKTAKFYVDYRLIGAKVLSRSTFGAAASDLILGQNCVGWGAFNGCMDEVRISDRVLGPAEFLRVTDAADAPQMFPETAVYQRFAGYPDFFGPRTSVFDEVLLLNEAPQATSFGEPSSISKFGAGYSLTDEVPVRNVATGYVGVVAAANGTAIALRSTEESRKSGNVDLPSACPCWVYKAGAAFAQGDFTAETFIRLTNVVKNTYIFYQGDAWSLSIDSSIMALNSKKIADTSLLTDGIWHHVALVVDGTTHTGSVYVDYRLKLADVPMSSGTPDERFGIGCYAPNCFITFYDVDFDDIRVTRRKLAPGELLHQKQEDDVVCACAFDDSKLLALGSTAVGTIEKTGWGNLTYSPDEKPAATVADGVFDEPGTNKAAAVVVGPASGGASSGFYTLSGDDIGSLPASSFTLEFQAKLPAQDYTNYTGNAGYLAYQDLADGSNPLWCLAFQTPPGWFDGGAARLQEGLCRVRDGSRRRGL